jgi:hypothetical protein
MTSNPSRPYPEDNSVRTFTRRLLAVVPTALLGGMLWGCGSDEQQAVLPDHTPTRYNLIINSVPATAPYKLKTKGTYKIQIKFFNKEDEDLDDVESEHFGGLRLSPGDIGSVTRVSDRHYQFDVVTGPNPVTGTLQVTFGHDEQANEVTFDPEPVTVAGGGLQ